MMTWIALLLVALALGGAVAIVSSRRVRTLRDELFEDALPSARTGETPGPAADRPAETARREDWGLRWADVTNLTPAGPDRPSGSRSAPAEAPAREPVPVRARSEEETPVRS